VPSVVCKRIWPKYVPNSEGYFVSWRDLLNWPESVAKHQSIRLNEQLFHAFDTNRNIASYEFVVFDTELTGLNRQKDEIVSIAAVRIRNTRILLADSFHSYVRTRKKLLGEGTFIHRITPQQILLAPGPEEVLPEFVKFCHSSVLVGHLPALDFSFLNKALKRNTGGLIRNPCLDSMELARHWHRLQKKNAAESVPKIRSFNLNELAVAYRVPLFPSHDALGDALQTACLFLFLMEKLRKCGLSTLKDFQKVGRLR